MVPSSQALKGSGSTANEMPRLTGIEICASHQSMAVRLLRAAANTPSAAPPPASAASPPRWARHQPESFFIRQSPRWFLYHYTKNRAPLSKNAHCRFAEGRHIFFLPYCPKSGIIQ